MDRGAWWTTSMGLKRSPRKGNGNPLQCSCLENPRDGGAWWAAVYGVAQSWTRLKRLSSSNTLLVRTLKIYLPRVWPVMWING